MGARVVLEVPPALKALLAGLDGVAAVIGRGEPLPPYDVHCPLGSLPLALKTDASNIPGCDSLFARRVTPPSTNGGRAWKGCRRRALRLPGPATQSHPNDRNRSLSLAQLEPLLSTSGMSFISVQRELRDSDAETLARDPRILNLGPSLNDFSDTAAVLTLADLVISVDTSVAHLAGALGRPAFVLLPFQPDWRWMLDRDASPWYPAVRLFRQTMPSATRSSGVDRALPFAQRCQRALTPFAGRGDKLNDWPRRRPTSLRADA